MFGDCLVDLLERYFGRDEWFPAPSFVFRGVGTDEIQHCAYSGGRKGRKVNAGYYIGNLLLTCPRYEGEEEMLYHFPTAWGSTLVFLFFKEFRRPTVSAVNRNVKDRLVSGVIVTGQE